MFLTIMSGAAKIEDDSLVLYLPFDEGSGDEVKDVTEYGNDGVLKGFSDKPVWIKGRYGSALEFYNNESNNWVEVPHSGSIGVTGSELTLMAWVMNKGQTTWGRVMDKNHPYLLYMGADDSLGGYVDGVVDFHDASIPVTREEWVHVASVFNGEDIKLYVNGEESAVSAAAGTIPDGSRTLTIGDSMGDTWMHTRFFIGGIDEVRIYDRVLTPEEVEAAMPPIELAVQPAGKLASTWGRIKDF